MTFWFWQIHRNLHSSSFFPALTHEVGHYLAHRSSKDEILEDAGDQGEGHAENSHHQVTDGERQQKGVGHSAHALVGCQHHNNQQVAKHAQEEDERVKKNPQCVVLIWYRKRAEGMLESGNHPIEPIHLYIMICTVMLSLLSQQWCV